MDKGGSMGRVIFSILSVLLGILSIANISRSIYDVGFYHALDIIITYYDTLSRSLFGWLTPILTDLLKTFGRFVGIDFNIGDHWRHVFIVLGLYYFKDVGNFYYNGYRVSGVAFGVLGLLISLISSTLVSSIDVLETSFIENTSIAAYTLWGFLLYRIMRGGWAAVFYKAETGGWSTFWGRFFAAFGEFTLLISVVFHFNLLFDLGRFPGTPLILCGIWIISYAALSIFRGGRKTLRLNKTRKDNLRDFYREGSTQIGIDIVSIYLYAALFLLVNAGLQQVGL